MILAGWRRYDETADHGARSSADARWRVLPWTSLSWKLDIDVIAAFPSHLFLQVYLGVGALTASPGSFSSSARSPAASAGLGTSAGDAQWHPASWL